MNKRSFFTSTEYLTGFCVLLNDCAILSAMLLVPVLLNKLGSVSFACIGCFLCVEVLFLVNGLLRRSSCSYRFYILGNAFLSLCAGGLMLYFANSAPYSLAFGTACFLGGVIISVHGAYMTIVPSDLSQLVLYEDFLVIVFALELLADSMMTLDTSFAVLLQQAKLLTLLALFGTLFALIINRTLDPRHAAVGGQRTSSFLSMAGVVLLCTLSICIFLFAGSGNIQSLSALGLMLGQKLLALLLSLARFLGGGILMFISWLASLLPEEAAGQLDLGEAAPAFSGAVDETSQTVPLWVTYLIGAFGCLLLIIALLKIFHKQRLSGLSNTPQVNRSVKRSNGLFLFLKEKLTIIRAFIVFHIMLFKNWKTPEGIYLRLEALGKHRKLPKGADESGPHYVSRLAEGYRDQSLKILCKQLSTQLERNLYADAHVRISRQEYSNYHQLFIHFPKFVDEN
ncbi:MAG: hypothetical protein PHP50_09060 [Lachnospiraceae bacterium]|nr:hypothetical protein [Lachnospiraceae bacterium]